MISNPQVCCVGRWAWTLTTVVLLGCGGREYDLANISGTVTLDGKPLADATVTFTPIGSGIGPTSFGTTDATGHYRLQTIDLDLPGAVLGTHRVSITTARADSYDERATISKEIVPPRFRDGSFPFEVDPNGSEAANIDMQSKGK